MATQKILAGKDLTKIKNEPEQKTPDLPIAKTTTTFTIINYRQCSPVQIPAIYNHRFPASAAQEPTLKIYSTTQNSRPNYSVPANIQRTVIFEKRLAKLPTGKWELINDSMFTLELSRDIALAMKSEYERGQKIVVTIEDTTESEAQHATNGIALYASSQGLPGHGAIPAQPEQNIWRTFAEESVLPASLATIQIGTILKGSTNETGDSECDGEGDPLVIDFANTGFKTIAPKVAFDLSARGAKDVYGWTAPNSQLGFLALDVNNNGIIDDGSELFSNYMLIADEVLATNGFEALKSFDQSYNSGNQDGIISKNDKIFKSLKVWFDHNSDGKTDLNELVSLEQTGVVSINLDYITSVTVDSVGNKIIGTSQVKTNRGGFLNIADLWFRKK